MLQNNTSLINITETTDATIAEIDSPVMVDVRDVSMIFNIASEQLNSLKEYAIALSRRELRFKEFRALDGVSFQVKRGDVFGILGTNGSGKSTVLKIIAGVLEPSEGTCTVNGNIAPLIELGAGFDMELTARENIFLNGALLGYSKPYIQEHFNEIVEFAEVTDFLDMPMKNYSSGMVARIAFAIATVIVPDILIVDEALSVGDFMFQQKCERRIQSLINDHDVTVLIVSHSNEQIERLCNKAVWIEKGHVRTIGSAKKVCEVYRAIGGRTGSAESEEYILGLLDQENRAAKPRHVCLFGDDRYSSAIQASEHAAAENNIVILANSDDERSNRIASGLASILGASLLTTRPDHLPSIVAREIKHRNPERILLIGNDKLIHAEVGNELSEHCDASIIRLESKESCGMESFEFARNTWGETAVIATENAGAAMTTLSPHAFNLKSPIFYVPNSSEQKEALKDALGYFSRFIVIDTVTSPINLDQEFLPVNSTLIRFTQDDPEKINYEINDWVRTDCTAMGLSQPHSLVITAPDNEVDNHIVGPLAGRSSALVLFESLRSLDSMTNAMKYAKKHCAPEGSIIYIGGDLRFNSLARALMDCAIQPEAQLA